MGSLDSFEDKLIIIGAFRYYLGLRSIAVSSFTEQLCRAWANLREDIKIIIERELEDAFARDDKALSEIQGEPKELYYMILGDKCLRVCWEEVRAKYKTGE